MNRNLLYKTISAYFTAMLVWTILFYKNPYLKDVLFDIHLIFSSTLIGFILIDRIFSASTIDFIKVFIRTLFRVWLFIFITYAISNSMERIGILLSLTFIFGYLEGLIDVNKWLSTQPTLSFLISKDVLNNKINQTTATIFLMSIIHILCAIVVLLFYLGFNEKEYFYEPYLTLKRFLTGS